MKGAPWRRRLPPELVFLLAAALLVSAAYAGLTGARIAHAYRELLEAKTLLLTAESALKEKGLGAEPEDIDRAETRILEARQRFRSARDDLAGEPLVWIGRRLPWLGAQLGTALALADIGLEGSELGLAGAEILRRFDAIRVGSEGGVGPTAVAFLEEIEPQVGAIEARLAAIERIRGDIAAPLPPSLAGVVERVDEEVAEVRELTERYHHARSAAPPLLGFDRPRRYLVLGQDNTELFPTGGIIALYGTLTLDQGELRESAFHSSRPLVDRWLAGGNYAQPPAPLERYLLRGWSWNFTLANWSPDFPTAARKALWFYRQAGGEPVDGVIGLDFAALEGLLSVTGPVPLEEYGFTLDAGSATEEILIRTRVPAESDEEPHAVAVAAARRVLEAAFALPSDRWDDLLRTMDRLAREKHLFLYSLEGPLQASLRALGWDGGLAPIASDYLMPVEASVHSTKLNLVVRREMRLQVRLDEEGTAYHRLTLRYRNGLDRWAQRRDPHIVRWLMLDGLYGGYLRLLAPPQARLAEVTIDGRPAGAEEIGREQGRASFGRYFALARGQEREVGFSYRVPGVAREEDGRWQYHLYIQKQGGTPATLLVIDLELPGGRRPRQVALNGEPLAGAPLHIETSLFRDLELTVAY